MPSTTISVLSTSAGRSTSGTPKNSRDDHQIGGEQAAHRQDREAEAAEEAERLLQEAEQEVDGDDVEQQADVEPPGRAGRARRRAPPAGPARGRRSPAPGPAAAGSGAGCRRSVSSLATSARITRTPQRMSCSEVPNRALTVRSNLRCAAAAARSEHAPATTRSLPSSASSSCGSGVGRHLDLGRQREHDVAGGVAEAHRERRRLAERRREGQDLDRLARGLERAQAPASPAAAARRRRR